VESEQEVRVRVPVVPFDSHGAERLGRTYWREVERSTRHVIRARARAGRIELRLLGGPVLLCFDRPRLEASPALARCTYPILGGFLARRRAGEISFAQIDGDGLRLRSSIRGFFPQLAAREGEPDWTGALYDQVQSRVHVAISHRYFARLVAEAAE